MGHEIDFSKGKAAFISKLVPAWHNLGTVFTEDVTVKDALIEGGLDYYVQKSPNIHRFPNGEEITSSTSFFLYRTDTMNVLASNVGRVYESLQNIEALAIVDDLVSAGMKIETAGVLREGGQSFVSLKAGDMNVKGDQVNQYLLVVNSHDGKNSIRVMFTPVRVVCANTLAMATGTKAGYKIRHSRHAEDRMKEAMNLMGLLERTQEKTTELFNHMAETNWNTDDFGTYIANVMLSKSEINQLKTENYTEVVSTRKRNQIASIIDYADNGPGQDVMRGTAWWGYNAVTGWLRHEWKEGEALFPCESLAADTIANTALSAATKVKPVDFNTRIIFN